MLLYHATTRRSALAIAHSGILVSWASPKANLKAVWLHSRSLSPWALLHTQKRHRTSLENLVVIEVSIPRSWLKRFRSGIWYCTRDIPAERLGQIIPGMQYAASAK